MIYKTISQASLQGNRFGQCFLLADINYYVAIPEDT